jgi:glycosyltransferase involved in cell wall biosynthesis
MKLSIIIPFLNEEDLNNTIESIYQTSDCNKFELILLDDCSDEKTIIPDYKEIKLITNKERIGVDACRQLGSEIAKYENLCFFDSHMRFENNCLENMLENIKSNPKTIWCTTCMGLGYGTMDLNTAKDKYRGADITILNKNKEILEPKWRFSRKEGKYEIPCVLGANYGVNKKWFEYIHGLKGLKMWGCSEMFMSLKSWMAGGDCKIDTNINIGHKFRDYAPYSTAVWNLIYNKLYMLETIFPKEIKEDLMQYFKKTTSFRQACKKIEEDKNIINEEKKYYNQIFTRDIYELFKKWDIKLDF